MNTPRILLPSRLVHKTPLETTRKASAATSAQTRVFDSLDDPRVALEDDVLRAVPVAS